MMTKTFKTTIRYPDRRLNFFKHFTTPANLPFLHYVSHGEYEAKNPITDEIKTYPKMSLELKTLPIIKQPSFEDIWTNIDIKRFSIKNNENARLFACNVLFNEIARKTRRACGNIVFVHDDAEKKWFDMNFDRFFPGWNRKAIVDATLEPNEMRATYWKVHYKQERVGDEIITTDIPVAIDGGIQISPEGFSAIRKVGNSLHDYRDYFVRGFICP